MITDSVRLTIAVPRSEFVVVEAPPEFVTQKNADAVLGMTARAFLDLVGEMAKDPACTIEIVKRGKLRMVPREDLVRHLRATGRRRALPAPAAAPANDGQGNGVLAELGYVRRQG